MINGPHERNSLSSKIELVDQPETVKRPVTSRRIHSVSVHDGSAIEFTKSLGFSVAYECLEQGYRLQYRTIAIQIYQVFKVAKYICRNRANISSHWGTCPLERQQG